VLFSSRGARALRERERERERDVSLLFFCRSRLFFFIRFFLNRSIVGTPLGLCALLEKTSLRAAFFRCVGAYLVLKRLQYKKPDNCHQAREENAPSPEEPFVSFPGR